MRKVQQAQGVTANELSSGVRIFESSNRNRIYSLFQTYSIRKLHIRKFPNIPEIPFPLNTRHMPGGHTAVNIVTSLEQLCAHSDIRTDCVRYILTDNGRNIRAAARRLPWFDWPCSAHTVQLGISDARTCPPAIKILCKNARSIVGHYKYSPSVHKRLDDLHTQLNNDALHVVGDVDTSWNSQYLMLSRLLELK